MRDLRFITAVKIQVEVFWLVTPYSAVARHQRFERPFCHHLQCEVNQVGGSCEL